MSAVIVPERSVFVSYARKDRRLLGDLLMYLKSLELTYGVSLIWDDSDIQGGEAWEQKIERYLSVSPLAILFVSSNFAASEFIRKNELPTLLKRHARGEVELLPVVAGIVELKDLGLDHLQAVANREKPLDELLPAKRKRIYQLVREWIENRLNVVTPTSPFAETRFAKANEPAERMFHSTVGEALAAGEIRHQLERLIKQTHHRGYVVFSRAAYYVQFDYYKELQADRVSIEVISNAFLPSELQLSKLQMKHLTDIHFTQATPEENWKMLAAIDSDDAASKMTRVTWHVLDEVLNCPAGSMLEVEGQCW